MSRWIKCIAGLCSGIGTGDVLQTFAVKVGVDQKWLFWVMVGGTIIGVAGAALDCRRPSRSPNDCNITVITWQLILIAVAAPIAADAFSLGRATVDSVSVAAIVPWFVGWALQATGAFRAGGPLGPQLQPATAVAARGPSSL